MLDSTPLGYIWNCCGKPLAAFVVSRAIKNTKLSNEISDALKHYDLPVLKAQTTQKVIYPTSASEGCTVYHTPFLNDAGIEINELKDEIMRLLNGVKN